MTHRIACLFAAVALLTLPLTARAWDDCTRSALRKGGIDTTGAERVEILARAGDLTVGPASGTALGAAGRACASRQELLDRTQLHVRRVGNVVQVHVQTPDDMSGIGVFYAYLDLQVVVPQGMPVEITDSSGDIGIDGVKVVRITDSSGDITARRLPADVEIDDSSGDVRVEDAAGAVRVSDSSGDVLIRGAKSVHVPRDSSGDLVIERVSGDVRIDQDSSGDVLVSNVDGNFELLADGSGQVRVTAVQGSVRLP
jgi:hypothetical protein